VKTGIQDTEEENWIPACAGMTDKGMKMGKVDFKSAYYLKPLALEAGVV
jgi:hypothetical protein